MKEAIERAVSAVHFVPFTQNQEITEGILFCNICAKIRESRIAFFVVNDGNANVALEAGFAIGWGKPAFLISKGEPFSNVRGLQRIQYSNLSDLETKVKMALKKYKTQSKALFKAKAAKIAALVGVAPTDPRFEAFLKELGNFNSEP